MKRFYFSAPLVGIAVSLALTACPAPVRQATALGINPGQAAPSTSARGFHIEGDYVVLAAAGADAVSLKGRILDVESLQAAFATVIFTDALGRFMVVRDSPSATASSLVAARVKPDGSFATIPVFPAGLDVFPTVLLPANKRLVGFGKAETSSDIVVSVASTYVVESLREAAQVRGVDTSTWLSAPGRPSELNHMIQLAEADLEAGHLPKPDATDGPSPSLTAGSGRELANLYVSRCLPRSAKTRQIWNTWFDEPIRPLVTVAGNFQSGVDSITGATRGVSTSLFGPAAVSVDTAHPDRAYLVESDAYRLRILTASGTLVPLVGETNGDTTVIDPKFTAADGTTLSDKTELHEVREVKTDADGNLAFTFNARNEIAYLCRSAGNHFGRSMQAETLYRLGDFTPEYKDDKLAGYQDGALADARFRGPHGLAFDEAGNLYVADRLNNMIRRIDRASGQVSTVLGDGWPALNPPATGDITPSVPDRGRLIDRSAAPGSGRTASFNRPLSLVWRKAGNNQELYIYDSLNNVIRRATAPLDGSFVNGAVETYAGVAMDIPGRTFSVRTGTPGSLDGSALSATFHLATNDVVNGVFQLVQGGLALDASRSRLYVTDTVNESIRMIDLVTGRVSTVARNGKEAIDGDARGALLSNNLAGLAVLPDGSLLICDKGNHVVRRLYVD